MIISENPLEEASVVVSNLGGGGQMESFLD